MNPSPSSPSVWRTAVPLMAGLVLLFALLVLGLFQLLVQRINQGIQERDANTIQTIARLELEKTVGELGPSASDPALLEFLQWEALLSTADYPGIQGIQLFDTLGLPVESIPAGLPTRPLGEGEVALARNLRSRSEFIPDARDQFELYDSPVGSLLRIVIPLHFEDSGEILGIAVYWIDGAPIEAAFSRVRGEVSTQSLVLFLAGSVLLLGASGYAFARIHFTQRKLQQRSLDLIRANADLSLAVKTNVLGTLASHLLHDLKNPLSALGMLIDAQQKQQPAPLDPEDLQFAGDAIRQMEDRVREIAEILREEKQAWTYEVTLSEFRAILIDRLQPDADAHNVPLLLASPPDAVLDSHRANLLLLILTNLCRNAFEVTPQSFPVSITFALDQDRLRIAVADHGPGVPETIRRDLFSPGRSAKPGGTGLGLAISKQIAYHLEAELRLARTSPEGSTFEIALPLETPVTLVQP